MRDQHDGTGHQLDAGLQPERTTLAWQRTVLSLTVASAVSLRLLVPPLGVWGVAIGVGGTFAGLGLAVLARRRGARVAAALRTGTPMPDAGLMLAFVACTTAGGALVSIVAVLSIITD